MTFHRIPMTKGAERIHWIAETMLFKLVTILLIICPSAFNCVREDTRTRLELLLSVVNYGSRGEHKILNTVARSTVKHIEDLPVPLASALKLTRVYKLSERL